MLSLTNDVIVTLYINRFNDNTLNVSIKGTANQIIEHLKSLKINLENDNSFIHFLSQLKNTFNKQTSNEVCCFFHDSNGIHHTFPIVANDNPVKHIDLTK